MMEPQKNGQEGSKSYVSDFFPRDFDAWISGTLDRLSVILTAPSYVSCPWNNGNIGGSILFDQPIKDVDWLIHI